jgi:NADH:ubiquinone oxidoreductase subunit K
MINPVYILYTAIALFAIGLAIVLTRKSFLFMLIGVELMLNSVTLNLVAFNRLYPENTNGQTTALFIMVLAICETATGVALFLMVVKHYKTISSTEVNEIKEQA